MAYVAITDSQVDPDAPLTSSLGYQFRDNPLAMILGLSGAPRVQQGAMGTWYTTDGGLGTYMLAKWDNTVPNTAFGGSVAGSALTPTGVYMGTVSGSLANGPTQSGTWRVMGRVDGASTTGATLFIRIA